MSLRFSCNSEAFASELQENLKDTIRVCVSYESMRKYVN